MKIWIAGAAIALLASIGSLHAHAVELPLLNVMAGCLAQTHATNAEDGMTQGCYGLEKSFHNKLLSHWAEVPDAARSKCIATSNQEAPSAYGSYMLMDGCIEGELNVQWSNAPSNSKDTSVADALSGKTALLPGQHRCGESITNVPCDQLQASLAESSAPRIEVASFTPRSFGAAVKESGWTSLGESDQSSYWYAYWTGNPDLGTAVILKSADKSIGKGYNLIKVMSGFADCREARSGIYPSHLELGSLQVFDGSTGYPPPGYADLPQLGVVMLQRGTILAEAVKKSCDAVSRR